MKAFALAAVFATTAAAASAMNAIPTKMDFPAAPTKTCTLTVCETAGR